MSTRGARLREVREGLGLSQGDLGAICGVERNAQGRYEGDDRAPDWNYLARLAQHGGDVHYVITGQRIQAAAALLTAEEGTLVETFRRASAEGRAAMAAVATLAQQQSKK